MTPEQRKQRMANDAQSEILSLCLEAGFLGSWGHTRCTYGQYDDELVENYRDRQVHQGVMISEDLFWASRSGILPSWRLGDGVSDASREG